MAAPGYAGHLALFQYAQDAEMYYRKFKKCIKEFFSVIGAVSPHPAVSGSEKL